MTGGAALTIAALGFAALPAGAVPVPLTTGSFTIGSPTGAVSNLTVSDSSTAISANGVLTFTFTPGALTGSTSANAYSITVANDSSNATQFPLPATGTLSDSTAGWSETVTGTAGNSVTYQAPANSFSAGASDTVTLQLAVANPGTAGTYKFDVTTSANQGVATASVTITGSTTSVTVTASSQAQNQPSSFTITNGSVAGLASGTTEGYIALVSQSTAAANVAVWTTNQASYSVSDTTAGKALTASAVNVLATYQNTGGTTDANGCSAGAYCSVAYLTLASGGSAATVTEGDTLTVTGVATTPNVSGAIDTFKWAPATGAATGDVTPATVQTATNTLIIGTAVSGVTVTPSPSTAGATSSLTVSFKITSGTAPTTITISEPSAGTSFTGVTSATVSDANQGDVAAIPSGQINTATAGKVVLSGLTWAHAPAAGDTIVVTLYGVVNPSSAQTVSTLSVSTSADQVPAPAAAYSITAATSATVAGTVTVVPGSTTPGALVTYTISNIEAAAAIASGTNIEIKGTAPGLVFPGAAADYVFSVTPSGSTTATSTAAGTITSGGNSADVVVQAPVAIASGSTFTITVNDVINPSSAGSYTLSLGSPTAAGNTSLEATQMTEPFFPSANVSYPNGAIVNFNGTIYVFAGGHAFGAPTPAAFQGVQRVDHATVLNAAVGSSVPTAAPRPGTLIVLYNNPTIWVVGTDGALHGFATPTQFLQDGYDAADVITVPGTGGLTVSTSTVGVLGTAANALATSSDGAIVNNNGTFYVFAGGRAWGIATPAQLAAVQAGNYTSTILSGAISSAATTATVANGVVVTLNGTVYVASNGALLAFKSMAQLMADGYGGTPSIIVPNASALSLITAYQGS